MIYTTEQLILREWQEEDLEAFIALNQDPKVLEFIPKSSVNELKSFFQRILTHFKTYGYGLYATCLKEDSKFIGYVGLNNIAFETPFTPAVEVGWRIVSSAWGKGYATEAAQKALEIGFEEVGLKEIVAYTVVENWRSRRVMEKIGMHYDVHGDFNHPKLPLDHPFSRHVLYRKSSC